MLSGVCCGKADVSGGGKCIFVSLSFCLPSSLFSPPWPLWPPALRLDLGSVDISRSGQVRGKGAACLGAGRKPLPLEEHECNRSGPAASINRARVADIMLKSDGETTERFVLIAVSIVVVCDSGTARRDRDGWHFSPPRFSSPFLPRRRRRQMLRMGGCDCRCLPADQSLLSLLTLALCPTPVFSRHRFPPFHSCRRRTTRHGFTTCCTLSLLFFPYAVPCMSLLSVVRCA